MMFESQMETYKAMPPWKRCLIMAVLGAIFPVYIFFDQGARVEEELTKASESEQTARSAFDIASKKKEKISDLSENLQTTKEQLEIATRLLPDDFYMDEILQATAEVAKDLGISLQTFAPKVSSRPFSDVKFEEMPIDLVIEGNFNKVAVFFDKLVHLDKLVHIRELRISANNFNPEVIEEWALLSPEQKSKRANERALVTSSAKMVVFRGLR